MSIQFGSVAQFVHGFVGGLVDRIGSEQDLLRRRQALRGVTVQERRTTISSPRVGGTTLPGGVREGPEHARHIPHPMVEHPAGGKRRPRLALEIQEQPALAGPKRLPQVQVAVDPLDAHRGKSGDLIDARAQGRCQRTEARNDAGGLSQPRLQALHHLVQAGALQHAGGEAVRQIAVHPEGGLPQLPGRDREVHSVSPVGASQVPAVDCVGVELLDHGEVTGDGMTRYGVAPATADPPEQSAHVDAADLRQTGMHLDVGIHAGIQQSVELHDHAVPQHGRSVALLG